MSLIIAATMPLSWAQNANPAASTLERSGAAPHSSGGGGDQTSQTKDAAIRDSEAAKDQPFMATGLDLKGPPTKFPAARTPE
jgi:hypothetical protein